MSSPVASAFPELQIGFPKGRTRSPVQCGHSRSFFLHLCMIDIAENPKGITRRMPPGGSDCLVHVPAHEIRSTTCPAAPLHCPLALLICFATARLPGRPPRANVKCTHGLRLRTDVVANPLEPSDKFRIVFPHIQLVRRVLTSTRIQPFCKRYQNRKVSTVSMGITVAVSVPRFLSTSESINALSPPPPHVASRRVQATPRIRITTAR